MTDYFSPGLGDSEINRRGVLALAHLGDAVYELMARTHLTLREGAEAARHKETVRLVRADAQAEAYRRIAPLLTEREAAIFRRGRNAKTGTAPKSADRAAYRAATGLEALFGHLYLAGERERLCELFREAIAADGERTEEKND